MVFIIVGLAVAIIWGLNGIFGWFESKTQEIAVAMVLAVTTGLLIPTVYNKLSTQSKMLESTHAKKTDELNFYAQLVLPNNRIIIVDVPEKVIGREDFLGVVISDKLHFIGKKPLQDDQKE